ncbi:Fc.00g028010.m01.CDS01 [Cosmosporella sp. VM-42]
MPPEPKRKRGRPANASKPTTASQDRPDEYEADVEEDVRPRKRGRPKKSLDDAPEDAPALKVRKRGRPSLAGRETQVVEAEGEGQAPSKRKRGRPSLEKQHEEDATEDQDGKTTRKKGPKAKDDEQPEVEEEAQPEEPPQQRKRGRKPAEPKAPEESEQQEEAQPAANNKQGRKPAQPEHQSPDVETEKPEEAQPAPKSKRGRKPAEPEEPEDVDPAPKSKRGRKPAHPENEAPEVDPPQPSRRKRGRPSLTAEEPQEEEPQPEKPRRKRGRPSITTEEPQEEEPQPEKPRRRGRPSLQDLPLDDAQNKAAKEKKPRKGRVSTAQEDDADKAADTPTNKPSRRSSGRPSLNPKDKPNDAPEEDTSRRRSSQNNTQEPPPSPEKPYLHIAPRTKRIRPSTITSKWAPLLGPSVPAATNILHLAHRPILQRMSHTRQRREHASVALRLITHRISKKLSKGLPFPPASVAPASRASNKAGEGDGGRETELDFEAVLDARTALERQLGPGLQAVELLRKERERMEEELERDYEALRGLEASARGQARERRELLKKAHVLVPTGRGAVKDYDDELVRNKGEVASGNLFKNLDETLNPLALQLAGHVESIRSNLQQADGIVPQIRHSRAALQDVLFRYLERGSYEQVILG